MHSQAYSYTHRHSYIHTHIYAHMPVLTYTCIHRRTLTHAYARYRLCSCRRLTHSSTHVRTLRYTHMHPCHTRAVPYACTYDLTSIHSYVLSYTHVHTSAYASYVLANAQPAHIRLHHAAPLHIRSRAAQLPARLFAYTRIQTSLTYISPICISNNAHRHTYIQTSIHFIRAASLLPRLSLAHALLSIAQICITGLLLTSFSYIISLHISQGVVLGGILPAFMTFYSVL